MVNAAVLPVPVSAQPNRSLPLRATGIAWAWIEVGLVYSWWSTSFMMLRCKHWTNYRLVKFIIARYIKKGKKKYSYIFKSHHVCKRFNWSRSRKSAWTNGNINMKPRTYLFNLFNIPHSFKQFTHYMQTYFNFSFYFTEKLKFNLFRIKHQFKLISYSFIFTEKQKPIKKSTHIFNFILNLSFYLLKLTTKQHKSMILLVLTWWGCKRRTRSEGFQVAKTGSGRVWAAGFRRKALEKEATELEFEFE